MSEETKKTSALLRRALIGNGTFSTISGIGFIAAAKPIASFIAIDAWWMVLATGVSLLGFAVGLFMNALRPDVNLVEARIAIALDFLWVIGSGIVIALGILSSGGNWGMAIVADVVLVFAVLQTVGLRRVNTSREIA
jgi:hypothetical protein